MERAGHVRRRDDDACRARRPARPAARPGRPRPPPSGRRCAPPRRRGRTSCPSWREYRQVRRKRRGAQASGYKPDATRRSQPKAGPADGTRRTQRPPRAIRSISARTSRSTMRRQVFVEPGLEHRPQHVLHEILEGARIAVQHRRRRACGRRPRRRRLAARRAARPRYAGSAARARARQPARMGGGRRGGSPAPRLVVDRDRVEVDLTVAVPERDILVVESSARCGRRRRPKVGEVEDIVAAPAADGAGRAAGRRAGCPDRRR